MNALESSKYTILYYRGTNTVHHCIFELHKLTVFITNHSFESYRKNDKLYKESGYFVWLFLFS